MANLFAVAERVGLTVVEILDMPMWEFSGWLDHFKRKEGGG